MPKEMDEIEDMDTESSTVPEDAVSEVAEQAAEAAPAESSTATDETEVDTLSIVRDVVGDTKEAPAEAAPSAEGEEGTGEGADDTTQAEEGAPDDYSDVAFHKHPRFQQLVRERNDLRGPAQEWAKVTKYMDDTGLSPAEAANGVTIMGLAKLNPIEAFKQVAPWFKTLAIAAGEILPDDLAARVQKGELPKDVAFEMSRLQAATKSQQVQQQFNAQRGERQQQTEADKALTTAAAVWENDRQLKDPNFAAKAPRIMEKLAFFHATEGKPRDVAGVKAQLKRAYDAVNKEIGPVAAPAARPAPQKKPAITPVRGGSVAGTARAEAPSGTRKTIDIINDVLAKRA